MSSMVDLPSPHADLIAEAVLKTFNGLPQKFKPRDRVGLKQEWVPLSGIVLEVSKSFTCVSLATGMKCLPKEKIRLANGIALHDCHAEVLSLRGFNSFLLHECYSIGTDNDSIWIERINDTTRPFKIRDHIRIHMYCSEVPCGDASMELTMAEQEDATPWILPQVGRVEPESGPIHGRGYFSQLGVVRTKPSRPDAPPTLCKSCTDKLALKQCTSALNSVASTLLSCSNAYIHSLVLPEKQFISMACERAFSSSGRFVQLPAATTNAWSDGYSYRPFHVITTSREFEFSRRSIPSHAELIASNISAVWTLHFREVLINGMQQGRKQFDPRGASALSRKAMWRAAVGIAGIHSLTTAQLEVLQSRSYSELKDSVTLQRRAKVKEDVRKTVLRPWLRNTGDEGFSLVA